MLKVWLALLSLKLKATDHAAIFDKLGAPDPFFTLSLQHNEAVLLIEQVK